MAVPSSQLERGEYQLITLTNVDPGVLPGATLGDFACRLAVPLHLEPVEDWVMCVAFASFPVSVAGLYQIATSANAQTMANATTVDTIAVIPAIASTFFSWVPVSTVVQWYPLASPQISTIEIEIADVDTKTPIIGSGASVVTLAFRKVGR